jgi:hypothetical protein
MAGFPRRTAIAALAGVGALATPAVAAAAPRDDQTITLTTRRKSISLPAAPPLGTPFSIDLELRDTTGAVIGDGCVSATVVELIVGPPPTIVTHDKVVLRLTGGEIHLSTMHERTVPNPGKKFPMAVLGGTGTYRHVSGDGVLEYTTAEVTTITLTIST